MHKSEHRFFPKREITGVAPRAPRSGRGETGLVPPRGSLRQQARLAPLMAGFYRTMVNADPNR